MAFQVILTPAGVGAKPPPAETAVTSVVWTIPSSSSSTWYTVMLAKAPSPCSLTVCTAAGVRNSEPA